MQIVQDKIGFLIKMYLSHARNTIAFLQLSQSSNQNLQPYFSFNKSSHAFVQLRLTFSGVNYKTAFE